ncbi:MAG: hypothetical protein ABH859_00490 [Pseudomonadota bacterium]
MSRTELNIKTNSATQSQTEQKINQTEQNSTVKASSVTDYNNSGFIIATKNEWQAMTSESTPIGEMMDAINGVEQTSSFKGPRDALLASFSGPASTISQQDAQASYDLPPVPKLQDLFEQSPHIQDNMESTVNKYELIQETLENLLQNAYSALQQELNAHEARATQDRIRAIESRLEENSRELTLANYYYELQQDREEIARELVDAETEDI